MKFNIGDRVRVVNVRRGDFYQEGAEGVIEKYDGSSRPYLVQFHSGEFLDFGEWWCYEDELELIEKAEDIGCDKPLEVASLDYESEYERLRLEHSKLLVKYKNVVDALNKTSFALKSEVNDLE